MEKIAVASDHGGFELKGIIVEQLKARGMEVEDLGTNGPQSVDYPDFAHIVAQKIANGESTKAILVCGTGIGMSITANRYSNVRAALCNDVFSAKMSRQHNDANVLVLGGRVIGPGLAIEIVSTWLEAAFEGGRHARRLDKIENSHLENAIHSAISSQMKEDKIVDKNAIEKIVITAMEKLLANGEKSKEEEK